MSTIFPHIAATPPRGSSMRILRRKRIKICICSYLEHTHTQMQKLGQLRQLRLTIFRSFFKKTTCRSHFHKTHTDPIPTCLSRLRQALHCRMHSQTAHDNNITETTCTKLALSLQRSTKLTTIKRKKVKVVP